MAFLNKEGLEHLWAQILMKLNGKVDKEEGKGLSTNDFTNEEKEKLAALDGSDNEMLSITYAELKSLRNNSELIPGRFYRIIDYICSTTQTGSIAADHKFDIIVQALSNNTLSENASADYHLENGRVDGYFKKVSITPEVIQYYIIQEDSIESEAIYDNTTDPHNDTIVAYDYAENNDGIIVPVLYKNDNESYPGEIDYQDVLYYIDRYTYEGIEYDRWRKIDTNFTWDSESVLYVLTNIIIENDAFIIETDYQAMANIPAWEIKYCLDNDIERFEWADTNNGKGVIYYMKDEWNNECPYDFKNIMFCRDTAWQEDHSDFIESLGLSIGDVEYFYTFSWVNEDLTVDDVTMRQDLVRNGEDGGIHDNIIKEYTDSLGRFKLSKNIFIITDAYGGEFAGFNANVLAYDCYNNTFGSFCEYNTFGNNCYNNIFGNDCYYNTLGNDCYHNIFGNLCRYNTFGNFCHGNIFGIFCDYNIFGSNCSYNIFNVKNNYCYVSSGCSYLSLTSNSNTGTIQNITIKPGVRGTSQTPLQLTVEPDAAPIVYEAAGTTHIILD